MFGTADLPHFIVTALMRPAARRLLNLRDATLFEALSGRLDVASR